MTCDGSLTCDPADPNCMPFTFQGNFTCDNTPTCHETCNGWPTCDGAVTCDGTATCQNTCHGWPGCLTGVSGKPGSDRTTWGKVKKDFNE